MTRPTLTRRRALSLLGAGTSAAILGGCANGTAANGAQRLEARVNQTHEQLVKNYPNAAPLLANAKGVLYMPMITEIGLGLGASYGQGALRVNGKTVDYYASTQASVGLQAGAQRYAHVLIFQTDTALQSFRSQNGWSAGADAFYALPARGLVLGADTLTYAQPVLAIIFGQTGIMAGASIEGTKYTRVVPSAF